MRARLKSTSNTSNATLRASNRSKPVSSSQTSTTSTSSVTSRLASIIESSSNRIPQTRKLTRRASGSRECSRTWAALTKRSPNTKTLTHQDRAERRRVRLLIADLYYNQKNYSQALTEYEKVIEQAEFDDLSEQAYLREATIYNARSQYRQALEVYRRLASQTADPESHRRAIYGIAEAHAGLFEFDEAIKALKQIEDESEQNYIAARITELEQKKRETAQARTGVQP